MIGGNWVVTNVVTDSVTITSSAQYPVIAYVLFCHQCHQ